MSTIHIPVDRKKWPTLGPQICDFMEQNLVFGPGDLLGEPLVLDEERRFWIYRMYEVYPKGHALAGRRRFQRAGISRRKGLAKTEFAALIAACELHPEAPVRCDGFTKKGEPIGCAVRDPYIPMVSFTEQQSDLLAYGALKEILDRSHLAADFEIGEERIKRRKGDGVAESLSANPSARDGARTTFSVMDETHRMTSKRHRDAHQTMLNNLPKRRLAQAWMLEITTAPEPGAGSVAEATMDYAKQVADGKIADASLFYFHVEASDHHDLTTEAGVRDAVIEASGMAVSWSDIDGIVNRWKDPDTDRALFERLWLNRLVKGGSQAFDVELWKSLARDTNPVKPGDLITIGFDGAQSFDSTGIVCTHVETGYQWVAGLWERPAHLTLEQDWLVPGPEVDEAMRGLFEAFRVWRLYADPPYWQSWIAKWAGDPNIGPERVIEWFTNRPRQMSAALENYRTSLTDGSICHDGDARLTRHIGNSRRKDLNWTDEEGNPVWLIQKESKKSPQKIDLAMASVLSWEARTDAIAAGALNVPVFDYVVRSLGDYL
jgi:phage terminase large subunit-like protein